MRRPNWVKTRPNCSKGYLEAMNSDWKLTDDKVKVLCCKLWIFLFCKILFTFAQSTTFSYLDIIDFYIDKIQPSAFIEVNIEKSC